MPNGEQAFVPPEKLSGYLLSETHPIGKAKARFFRSMGFSVETAHLLEVQLLAIARDAEPATPSPSPHGQKYSVVGTVEAADGRRALIQTVWIIESSDERPRFVTAYPA